MIILPPPPKFELIPINETKSIRCELEDGWFVVEDTDNSGYDDMGAVAFGLDELAALINALEELRAKCQ